MPVKETLIETAPRRAYDLLLEQAGLLVELEPVFASLLAGEAGFEDLQAAVRLDGTQVSMAPTVVEVPAPARPIPRTGRTRSCPTPPAGIRRPVLHNESSKGKVQRAKLKVKSGIVLFTYFAL